MAVAAWTSVHGAAATSVSSAAASSANRRRWLRDGCAPFPRGARLARPPRPQRGGRTRRGVAPGVRPGPAVVGVRRRDRGRAHLGRHVVRRPSAGAARAPPTPCKTPPHRRRNTPPLPARRVPSRTPPPPPPPPPGGPPPVDGAR